MRPGPAVPCVAVAMNEAWRVKGGRGQLVRRVGLKGQEGRVKGSCCEDLGFYTN